ncbi:hypothetical protein HRbin02_00717 [Candidatus Calditenuaceae archaeon HR02]|nr:hypothetical protein HRbin02_00717 [Candidatus Calditenuaceae archaeon HR02]
MRTLTVRISDSLRRRMRRLKGVNWGEVVRGEILERVMLEERSSGKDWDAVRQAARMVNNIRNSLREMYGESSYDSVELIRGWRESRAWRG